ncbi:Uu.00g068500.m01.CDS01 [Anthostomella pinea]|uniref:Uu.00g068500.m01.CDS01 n=1 Tax=Anthostomella pinea TaxID=933095 RepID=A0AAI8YNI6_9PEZI|nr:Uu.00g068500.m01.CDS01 [Anthostomella pinea]
MSVSSVTHDRHLEEIGIHEGGENGQFKKNEDGLPIPVQDTMDAFIHGLNALPEDEARKLRRANRHGIILSPEPP